MWSTLARIALSFLPRRYRVRFTQFGPADFRQGTIISGALELVVCLLLLVARFLDFIRGGHSSAVDARTGRTVEEAYSIFIVQGFSIFFEYLLLPASLLLIYLVIEGGVRFGVAWFAEDGVGSLPLCLIAWAQEHVGQARAERALGARVADIVEQVYSGDYDLRIFSCRPKRDWDRLITVSYGDQLYAVVGGQAGKPPYRHIYHLRKTRFGWTVRNIHHYDPQEVFLEEETPPPLTSRLIGWVLDRLGAARAAGATGPAVPDLVERISSLAYQLRVASCRPQPTWDHLITVEYEGEFYEIVEEKQGAAPHPYIYLLRKLPEGKAIRSLHHYRPEESLDQRKA